MFPVFTHAALLTGLAGVSAPILIHLLMRRRSQRMRFSTVQFFVKRDEQSMRKRKLRNLFLLSLRVILFTLLILAFARPYLPNSAAAGGYVKRQQAIILLDDSASMQSVSPNGERWKKAKESAKEILSHLQRDDRAALVLCSSRSATASGFVPASVLAKRLDDIPAGYGTADLSEGFQQALKLLATANPAFETSLHIVSDLQRSSTHNLASAPLPPELAVKIADPGERFAPNVAVTDLRLQREGDAGPHAVLTSFSDENYGALPYRLTIDHREVLAGTVALAGGASTNLALAIPALKPGWHSVELVIQPKDGLSMDDTRFATLLAPEPIRCLVVEPRPGARSYQEESFFVAAALNPVAAGEASSSRFACEKTSLDDLPTRLQAQPGRAAVRLIVLPASRQIPSAAANALKNFVQTGGGLLLFAGETVSANAYNSSLGELLPAEIGRREPAGEKSWHLGKHQLASPVFNLFREPANGNLALPEFTDRLSLKPASDATVLAEFDDGTPMMVERKAGTGRVLLANTSADTRWTDWPKHKSFVPWLHSAAFYLCGLNPAEQREKAPTFTSGSEADLAISLKEQAIKVVREGGEELAVTSDATGTIRDLPLNQPGIYSVRDAQGTELRRIAVNPPAAESDLTFAAPSEVDQQVVRRRESGPPTLAAGVFGESPKGRELWRVLLLGALLFLLVEPLVANRTAA